MVKLSYNLIINAKQGVCESLLKLASSITTQNYVLPALEAALVHLCIEDIRSPDYNLDGFPEKLRRVYAAIDCVAGVSRASRAPHPLKDATVMQIFDHVEDILFWIQTLLAKYEIHSQGSYNCVEFCMLFSTHIGDIVSLDPSIEAATFTSPKWINIVLRFWSIGLTFPTYHDLKESAVTSLMWKFMQHTDGLLILSESLTGNPKRLRQFCSDLLKRIKLTSKLLVYGVSVETVKDEHLLIKSITEKLQNFLVIEAALLNHGCLRHRMLELKTFKSLSPGHNILFTSFMSVHATTSSHQQLQSSIQIVEGGFVSAFFNGIQEEATWIYQLPRDLTLPMLRFLGTMSCYPRCMKALLPAVTSLPEISSNVFCEEHQELLHNCALFLALFRRRFTLYIDFMLSGMPQGRNVALQMVLDHARSASPLHIAQKRAKQMTGGNGTGNSAHPWRGSVLVGIFGFVVAGVFFDIPFFSPAFKVNHGVKYSQRTKEYQLLLVRESFASRIEEYQALISSHPSGLPPSSFIVILKAFHNPEQTLSIQLWEEWKVSRERALCEAMDDTADKLVEQFRTGSSTSTRLVEATFYWEALEIYLLVEITLPQSDVDSAVEIVRHVVRIV
ncbi:hypothetical protein BKA70DRAFT_1229287 [Coprinopsis sp. MPI-PUGE-AT-0042]|nr:hypothetical protein BKA70DRAFT_1229287 [Coprinopsis sp. MPI-PUGE-AT-0042]